MLAHTTGIISKRQSVWVKFPRFTFSRKDWKEGRKFVEALKVDHKVGGKSIEGSTEPVCQARDLVYKY